MGRLFMPKIRKVHIEGHPVLGDLDLDFCAPDGRAVDTVIIAGENGVGKSTVMGLLYELISGDMEGPFGSVTIELDGDEGAYSLTYEFSPLYNARPILHVTDSKNNETFFAKSDEFVAAHPMSAIYSDVDINFNAGRVSSVTSLTLDSVSESRRSSGDLPTKINQLLIDVQDLDDADVAYAARSNPRQCLDELRVEERMPRFTRAFEMMFDDLRYDRIDNRDGHKEIVFKKHGREVPIGALSSGEKQVVYRGCFLLKDANATKGAFVFIDEPEISLHPTWQQKVMDYYKAMFTDSSGSQTSQIFCVTHSPFVVHNDRRRDDKVIVLRRGADGRVEVEDKPEYYRCDSVSAIEDAFSVRDFVNEKPVVYLEGQTDEKYFKRAAEVFGFDDRVTFRWVGHHEGGNLGKGKCTGWTALNGAYEFLAAHNPPMPVVFLLDCDTKKGKKESGNVCLTTLREYENAKGITKGIENALALDGVKLEEFSFPIPIDDGYGFKDTKRGLKKAELCDFVCAKDDEELKVVFANLKSEMEMILGFFESCE